MVFIILTKITLWPKNLIIHFLTKLFFLNLSYDILNLSAIGSEKVSATVLLQILMTCAKIYKKRIAIIALRAKT